MQNESLSAQLLENPLLWNLFGDIEKRIFAEWCNSEDPVQREELYAQYKAAKKTRQFIKNKCEEIARV